MRWIATLLILTLSLLAGDVNIPDVTLLIPMRDGTELPADFYFPEAQEDPLPCILMRNPSGRRTEPWVQYATLSHFGFLVVIQDTRSAADPTHKMIPYWSDGWGIHQDGFDTVEWLAKTPFTNGNIGTIGFSAPGITQLLLAPSAPPSLKCQYIGVAASNPYRQCVFNGGQVLKNQVEGWLRTHGDNPEHLAFVLSQPDYNDFWHQLNTIPVADRVKVPAIHYGGWFDIFLEGTLDGFVSRHNQGAEGARGQQKLVIGPWTHRWPLTVTFGDFEVPILGRTVPDDISPVRWFDYYLRGRDNQSDAIPPVQYYVMGPFDGTPSIGNVWKTATNWPVPAIPATLYLCPDHSLDRVIPHLGNLSFLYDPEHPVPTLGGRNLFLESGPKDQSAIEQRPDVLIFTTEPLLKDLEVTGRIIAKIFFKSNQNDTDLSVRLSDVYPDGRSILITDGITRLGSLKASTGKPQEVEVDLYSTSMVFAKGHSIRIAITSSNYPRYEKNLNGPTAQVAENTLYMGGKYPSKIVFPIVPNQ